MIQHDSRYYLEPDKFNPENFSAENKIKRHPYAFLPFGQGRRNCVAMRYAMIEAKAAVAHVVHNFKIEPCEKTQTPPKISKNNGIKKPADGMWLKFTTREKYPKSLASPRPIREPWPWIWLRKQFIHFYNNSFNNQDL